MHTGLLAARHVVGGDVAVVAQGPGNLGTGTRWGYSGVAAGEAVNAADTLGGRAGRVPARLRRRPPRPPPRRLPPLPHRLRPRRPADPRRRPGPDAAGRRFRTPGCAAQAPPTSVGHPPRADASRLVDVPVRRGCSTSAGRPPVGTDARWGGVCDARPAPRSSRRARRGCSAAGDRAVLTARPAGRRRRSASRWA